MIDKNGKVFGKINIIDLLVIIVVIACIAVFGYSKLAKGPLVEKSDNTETVVMQFHTDELPGFVAERVSIGDKLYDADANLEMGEVTDVEVSPAKIYVQTDDGKIVVSEKEGYNSITITGAVKGKKGDFGVEIGTAKYGVGHSMTLRSGDAKIYLKVSDIKTK